MKCSTARISPILTSPSARRWNARTARYIPAATSNSSFGLTICAERTAAVKAISEGHSKFCRIVIAGNSKDFCYPCGACRQFLYEFSPDMEVICLNRAREAKRMTLRELMPCGFDSTFL